MNKSAKDNHSAQSIHLLLDTNVWIDNFFVERPKSKEARALITTAIRQNIPLYYSASTAKDFYYLVSLLLKHGFFHGKLTTEEENKNHYADKTCYKCLDADD